MMGSTGDPKDGKAVAGTVFAAVVVYGVRAFLRPSLATSCWSLTYTYLRTFVRQVFLVFCGFQAFLHTRQRARGGIALS